MRVKRETPGPGQESVWDYPRPPRVEDCDDRVRVLVADWTIAETTRAKRVLETSHPPVYYIPPSDVDTECLETSHRQTWCEFKGMANYYSVTLPGRHIENAVWYYSSPLPDYLELEGYLAFYPSRVDACYIGDEKVVAQPGDFYGGWITSRVVGPFKGLPGTAGW